MRDAYSRDERGEAETIPDQDRFHIRNEPEEARGKERPVEGSQEARQEPIDTRSMGPGNKSGEA